MLDPCLQCSLPICDDRSKDCNYRLIKLGQRQDYFKAYYRANREAILAKAKARKWKRLTKHQRYHIRHKEARNQYSREYRKRTKERQQNEQLPKTKRLSDEVSDLP